MLIVFLACHTRCSHMPHPTCFPIVSYRIIFSMTTPTVFPHSYHTSFDFPRTLSLATRVRQNQAPSRLRRRHPHRSAASPSMRSPRGTFSWGAHSQGEGRRKRYDFSTPPATMRRFKMPPPLTPPPALPPYSAHPPPPATPPSYPPPYSNPYPLAPRPPR